MWRGKHIIRVVGPKLTNNWIPILGLTRTPDRRSFASNPPKTFPSRRRRRRPWKVEAEIYQSSTLALSACPWRSEMLWRGSSVSSLRQHPRLRFHHPARSSRALLMIKPPWFEEISTRSSRYVLIWIASGVPYPPSLNEISGKGMLACVILSRYIESAQCDWNTHSCF